jgi:DNA polymerase III subunit epsilon
VYAIVDIETTGGSAKKQKITEIAIIVFDGKTILDRYEALINPEELIPRNIISLTGITNEMVESAPLFSEVADEIFNLLEGNIFVAHNVNFDYSFVRTQLTNEGFKWNPKRLCTVRLSRKLLPGMYSYSLGKLAQQLGYQIEGRHRAMGDCEFTAKLFQVLLEKDGGEYVKFSLNQRSREATLPPNLPREILETLPNTMGVYIFYDKGGKVIYVGKANKLKHRVSEHFRGNTHTGYKSHFAEKITDVKWIECPNELFALLTEAREIKKHWPPYNRLMKRVSLNWGIFAYKDQNGYGRFSIGRVGKWTKPLISFRNQFEARLNLEELRVEYVLCARYCDLQEQTGLCAEDVHGSCNRACLMEESPAAYNERYDAAIQSITNAGETLLIRDSGFNEEEQSLVLIEKGRYKGHGLAPANLKIDSVEDVLMFIETGYDDQDIQSIIRSHIQTSKTSTVSVLSITD